MINDIKKHASPGNTDLNVEIIALENFFKKRHDNIVNTLLQNPLLSESETKPPKLNNKGIKQTNKQYASILDSIIKDPKSIKNNYFFEQELEKIKSRSLPRTPLEINSWQMQDKIQSYINALPNDKNQAYGLPTPSRLCARHATSKRNGPMAVL